MYKFSYRSSCFTYITVIYSYTSPTAESVFHTKKVSFKTHENKLAKAFAYASQFMHRSILWRKRILRTGK